MIVDDNNIVVERRFWCCRMNALYSMVSSFTFSIFQNLKSFLHSCSIKATRGRTVLIILYPTSKTQAKPGTFIGDRTSYVCDIWLERQFNVVVFTYFNLFPATYFCHFFQLYVSVAQIRGQTGPNYPYRYFPGSWYLVQDLI